MWPCYLSFPTSSTLLLTHKAKVFVLSFENFSRDFLCRIFLNVQAFLSNPALLLSLGPLCCNPQALSPSAPQKEHQQNPPMFSGLGYSAQQVLPQPDSGLPGQDSLEWVLQGIITITTPPPRPARPLGTQGMSWALVGLPFSSLFARGPLPFGEMTQGLRMQNFQGSTSSATFYLRDLGPVAWLC